MGRTSANHTGGPAVAEELSAAEREHMVESQIRRRGISDEKILTVMRTLPRHLFIPDESRSEAYEDHPVSIGMGQTISQPYIVAFMTRALRLEEGAHVLEVGTGSGYQTAVLAGVARWVFSVEILPDLARRAIRLLDELAILNVSVSVRDGYAGWPEHAPYEGILVAAAAPTPPPELLKQLKPNARLVMPIGQNDRQQLTSFRRVGLAEWTQRPLLDVRFVPLVAA